MLLKKFVFVALAVVSYSSAPAFAQNGHEGMHMGGSAGSGQISKPTKDPYMNDTMASMDAMHKDMMDMSKMNGVPDHDFMVMMIPHHKGALDMAQIYLKYAKDPKVKKLAQGIIAAQKKEILQMEQWLKTGIGEKK
jgi:uncharacterized protein (DUF305 family)